MQRISEPHTNRRPVAEPTPCRWKHLRGHGTDAIYRASCGTGCPGHLGDLHFVDGQQLGGRISLMQPIDPDAPKWQLSARTVERLRAQQPSHHPRRSEIEHLIRPTDAYVVGGVGIAPSFASCWVLSASPLIGKPRDAIYRGYADSGYRIVAGGKRTSNRERVGRRGSRSYEAILGSRKPQGQTVQPPARIWCLACGTLGLVELPESLRSCGA